MVYALHNITPAVKRGVAVRRHLDHGPTAKVLSEEQSSRRRPTPNSHTLAHEFSPFTASAVTDANRMLSSERAVNAPPLLETAEALF